MEENIYCGDCQSFYYKTISIPRAKNPFRLGRLRATKDPYCRYYDQPARSDDFYGVCEVAKRKPIEVEDPGIATPDPETDPPVLA